MEKQQSLTYLSCIAYQLPITLTFATLRTEHRPRWGSPTCAYFDRCFCPKEGVYFCLGPSLGT